MSFSMSGGGGYNYNRFDEFEKALLESKGCGGDCDCEKCGEKKSKKKGAKPDFLDIDKDGDKEEDMEDAAKKKEEVDLEEGKSERPLGVMHHFARGVKQERGAKKDEGGKYLRQQHTKRQNEKEEKREAEKAATAERNATPNRGTWYKEETEVQEGIDFKGAKRIDDARAKAQAEKDKKNPSGKDYRLALRKFRPGASNAERAEGHRDNMREKGTSPIKNGKKMFEEIEAAGLFTAEELEQLQEVLGLGKRQTPEEKARKDREKKVNELERLTKHLDNPLSDINTSKSLKMKKEEVEEIEEGLKPYPAEKVARKREQVKKKEDIHIARGEYDKADKQYKRGVALAMKSKMKKEDLDMFSESELEALEEKMTEDQLRDRRQERGGVDGNKRYDHKSPFVTNTRQYGVPGAKTPAQVEMEKRYGKGASAMDVVKQDIEKKYGKGAILDPKAPKKEPSEEEKAAAKKRGAEARAKAAKNYDPYKPRAGESD